MLKLDVNSAKSADNINAQIRESGKYIGTITRAEMLISSKGTMGLGLSFKTDDGSTANYLDLYTINANGEDLPSAKTANAIMACLKLREAKNSEITVEKYNSETKLTEYVKVQGYPELMNKRIGFLLQKELTVYEGKDQERLNIFGVFQADTELTASEILEKKTSPEKLPKMLEQLMIRPIRDSRNKSVQNKATNSTANFSSAEFDESIPF